MESFQVEKKLLEFKINAGQVRNRPRPLKNSTKHHFHSGENRDKSIKANKDAVARIETLDNTRH